MNTPKYDMKFFLKYLEKNWISILYLYGINPRKIEKIPSVWLLVVSSVGSWEAVIVGTALVVLNWVNVTKQYLQMKT